RAAPRGHALRRAGRRLRGGGGAGHDGGRRPPAPGEGLPRDRRARPPGRPRSGTSRRRRRRPACPAPGLRRRDDRRDPARASRDPRARGGPAVTGPDSRLRLAFVVQRYGPEIDGGAEYECRRVAEALAPHHDVEVLTTCARDYLTWKNVYAPGVETINGVRVRRFPVDQPRRVRAFGRYADWLYATPHTFFDEAEWVRRQGPICPTLIEWIRAHADDHDGFV